MLAGLQEKFPNNAEFSRSIDEWRAYLGRCASTWYRAQSAVVFKLCSHIGLPANDVDDTVLQVHRYGVSGKMQTTVIKELSDGQKVSAYYHAAVDLRRPMCYVLCVAIDVEVYLTSFSCCLRSVTAHLRNDVHVQAKHGASPLLFLPSSPGLRHITPDSS
jgi:hypothetical protein